MPLPPGVQWREGKVRPLTGSQGFEFPSVLWHCLLGDKKDVRPIKNCANYSQRFSSGKSGRRPRYSGLTQVQNGRQDDGGSGRENTAARQQQYNTFYPVWRNLQLSVQGLRFLQVFRHFSHVSVYPELLHLLTVAFQLLDKSFSTQLHSQPQQCTTGGHSMWH